MAFDEPSTRRNAKKQNHFCLWVGFHTREFEGLTRRKRLIIKDATHKIIEKRFKPRNLG
jgi:hypothetical protein